MDKGNITFKNRLQELRWKNLPSTLPSSSRNQLWDCLPKQGPEQMLEWIVASEDTGFPWLCAEIEEIEVSWNDIKQLLISILNFGYKMLVKKRLFEHQIIGKYLLLFSKLLQWKNFTTSLLHSFIHFLLDIWRPEGELSRNQ